MTAISSVQENWDGSHHGVKIEVINAFPGGQAASYTPWTSSADHKRLMAQYGNSMTLISIARDRGCASLSLSLTRARASRYSVADLSRSLARSPAAGRIFLDSEQKPRMDYTIDPYDGQSLTRGTVAAAEIHLINGARRITTTQVDVPDYLPAPGHTYLSDPAWKEWVAKVEKAGTRPNRCAIGSAHQMGSNQMGTKPSSSVVDPRGRVWGTEGLYVADASVFPTASGVNPMITVSRRSSPSLALRPAR